jgi:hypothetical protein
VVATSRSNAEGVLSLIVSCDEKELMLDAELGDAARVISSGSVSVEIEDRDERLDVLLCDVSKKRWLWE